MFSQYFFNIYQGRSSLTSQAIRWIIFSFLGRANSDTVDYDNAVDVVHHMLPLPDFEIFEWIVVIWNETIDFHLSLVFVRVCF